MMRKTVLIIILLTLFFVLSATLDAQESLLKKKQDNPSPTGALLRSLAVPGWGQFYNGKYVKAAVIGIGESLLIYQTVYYWKRSDKYQDLYLNEDDSDLRQSKFQQFDRYRDLRNQHIWFLGIAVFYSMFDAYVDAHLKNIDVDLAPDFDSQTGEVTMWLGITYRY